MQVQKAISDDEFLDMMMEEAENTDDVFEIYCGSIVDDGSVCVNVKVNKDKVDKEEVRLEFEDMPKKYGWEYECFTYSSELSDEEGTFNILVYFRKAN